MTPISDGERLAAGGLALAFHLAFVAALVFSISWNQTPQLPVQAELWTSLPALPRPAPKPEPKPEPEPEPEAVKPPEPKPEPKVEPKPDIALQAKEEKRRKEEAAKKAEEEAKRKEDEKKKVEAEKKAQEAKRLAQQQALARQMEEELARESTQLAQMRQRAQAASARDKLVGEYQAKIIQKVRSYLRLPPNLVGNPEAVFQVHLLPNGDVVRAVLTKSSGQPQYDQEVERAILKATPLPLPPDPEAASAFRPTLTLKFRPLEG